MWGVVAGDEICNRGLVKISLDLGCKSQKVTDYATLFQV